MNKELLPNTTLSHYRIVSKIGAGGMGEVYLAQDTELDRTVAIKILPETLANDPKRLQRFIQEAKAASALNHPHILTIYEIGTIGDSRFIATELIDGETLRERMKAGVKLVDALEFSIQVAGALSAAHAAGIIHRDIKPENIMVRRDGYAKVLDFGLAKLTQRVSADLVDTEAPTSFKSDPGTVVGTAIYMSPEQARGLQVDARTDIFSLGVLLYEMVAGRIPFVGSNTNEIVAAILNDKEAAPLARYAPEVPAELERIVAKALRKSRDERYQTSKDLLLDLKALKQALEFAAKLESSAPPEARVSPGTAGSGQAGTATIDQSVASTVEARPTSSAEYLVTGIKQHKLAAALILMVFTVGIVGLAAYLHARNAEVTIESIAVLPFQNKSTEPDTEYLSDGLAESLIYRLSQLPNLKVSPTSSLFAFKNNGTDPITVGKQLGVNAVLSGRIVQRGDNLTISAELVDVRYNKLLWREQYDRKMSALLQTQREIAREIVEKLKLQVSGDEKGLAKHYTESNEAYQLYLRGRFYWNKRTEEGMQKSLEYFQQAIEKDPNFALAYSGLADAYDLLGWSYRSSVTFPQLE